jgi:hypothetical protein
MKKMDDIIEENYNMLCIEYDDYIKRDTRLDFILFLHEKLCLCVDNNIYKEFIKIKLNTNKTDSDTTDNYVGNKSSKNNKNNNSNNNDNNSNNNDNNNNNSSSININNVKGYNYSSRIVDDEQNEQGQQY